MLELVTCSVMGQELLKKNIQPEDYKLWSKLNCDKISDNGNWIAYNLRYESQQDTLFLKNVITNKLVSFPKGSGGKFAAEKIFGCIDNTKKLDIVDLVTSKKFSIQNVKSFEFSTDGHFIISLEINFNKNLNLCLRNKDGQLLKMIENVTEYKINRQKNMLIYATSYGNSSSVSKINFGVRLYFQNLTSHLTGKIQNLIWSKDETCIAFYCKNLKYQVFYYQFNPKKLTSLQELPTAFDIQEIARDNALKLQISDDNKAVFFAYKSSEKILPEKSVVEIWNANDKYLYPENQSILNHHQSFLGVWHPDNQKTIAVTNKEFPLIALTGNQKYAIIADPSRYEPQYHSFADVDYYIMDLKNGEKHILVKKVSSHSSCLGASPDGRFISYYKDQDWYLYDIKTKIHTNLTVGLGNIFNNSSQDPNPEIYGLGGWTTDGKAILIYDDYDIWRISIDKKNRTRLTVGKEKKIRFRLFNESIVNDSFANYISIQSNRYDLTKKNILSAESKLNGDSGYFIIHKNKVEPWVFKKAKINKLLKAKEKNNYIFIEQNFTNSPSIILKSYLSPQIKTVVKTNNQQQQFHWGFSEMIHYTNSNRIPLNGALFYPANYDSRLRYPMIVYIYSKSSGEIHNYINPTLHNVAGYNVTTLTANGYFVLFADISYEEGNPGISALDCVTNAVKSVNDRNIIDSSKVGLLGHSFGGYETNFILTQSNLFAAAISGSGVSDMIHEYFTINSDHLKPEIWRFENQQFRMNRSFYQDKDSYLRNSPILNAEKINTPLLTWTGKNDQTVKPEQTMAFFVALRRLQKTHIMLQYPNEQHSLSSDIAQEDLSRKTIEWFDYYLKKEKPADWILKAH